MVARTICDCLYERAIVKCECGCVDVCVLDVWCVSPRVKRGGEKISVLSELSEEWQGARVDGVIWLCISGILGFFFFFLKFVLSGFYSSVRRK